MPHASAPLAHGSGGAFVHDGRGFRRYALLTTGAAVAALIPANTRVIFSGRWYNTKGRSFFSADVPFALRAWSPLCSFFCRGRSLRPAGLESACRARSRGKGLIYASRQFVALLLTPPAGPPLPTGAAFAAMPCSFRGPQSRPLYQPIKRVVDSGR